MLKALEEVEKNFVTMRCMLSGDGENELNADQVMQLAQTKPIGIGANCEIPHNPSLTMWLQ